MGLTGETNDASARKWEVQDEPGTLYCSRKQKKGLEDYGTCPRHRSRLEEPLTCPIWDTVYTTMMMMEHVWNRIKI